MQEFFTRKETEALDRPDGKSYSCFSCGLYKNCKSPRMKPYGNFKKKILNIGEAPGEIEDQSGKPFQGKTGKVLQKMYSKFGIDLFEDCLNINAVHCRPVDEHGKNRPPTNFEIECCRRATLNVVYDNQPKVIVLLGNAAVYSMIGHRWKKDLGGIAKWRGFTLPDQDFQAWVCPTFHPSYIERSDSDEVMTIWKEDLEQTFDMIKEPFPVYKEPDIDIIEDLSVLDKIKIGEVAIDYETTGLKPHATGQRIVCTAVADTTDHCYVFMMPKTRQELQPFLKLLSNPRIGKIAHNMKYEDAWSTVRLKQPVVNWMWDTMQAAHIIDNRQATTNLKFQTYINFGIVDYASEIEPFLKPKIVTSGNDLNQIMDLVNRMGGKEKLLEYCGLDAVHEFRLAIKQRLNILPF